MILIHALTPELLSCILPWYVNMLKVYIASIYSKNWLALNWYRLHGREVIHLVASVCPFVGALTALLLALFTDERTDATKNIIFLLHGQ